MPIRLPELDLDKERVAEHLVSATQESIDETAYVYSMGSAFAQAAMLEHEIASALTSCTSIGLQGLPEFSSAGDEIVKRHYHLRSQTFGNLIKVLKNNRFPSNDIAYFEFVKRRRDRLIHGLFWEYRDVDATKWDLRPATLRILYTARLFARARQRVWPTLIGAGHVRTLAQGDWGSLIVARESELWPPDEEPNEAR